MKITVFTSNQRRHNYLINILHNLSSELFVIQEVDTLFPGLNSGRYPEGIEFQKYFKNVQNAEKKIFNIKNLNFKKKTHLLTMSKGDLNKIPFKNLSKFLKSDYYIVFGSSYIKGELVKFLIKNKAINIHMGVSPYYRGTDCNFWALYDDNPHYVGSTIHLLSEGLDSGQILYHAISEATSNPFTYTMSTVKSAFKSLESRILNKTLKKIRPEKQMREKEIRYSRRKEFDVSSINKFFKKKIKIFSSNNLSDFKEPFVLKKKDFYI
tara:strand:+ start:1921 stop:2718 length:798 start_codon:yes stop_codon:yes gene_type:complete